MPKNLSGGKHHKSQSNSAYNRDDKYPVKSDFNEGEVEYALVKEVFSAKHLKVAFPGSSTLVDAHVRGKVLSSRGNGRITKGDMVLAGIRDYQSTICDVIYKYTTAEAAEVSKNEDVAFAKDDNGTTDPADDNDINFDDI